MVFNKCGCGTGCGLAMATPIGIYFGCQKLTYGPIMLKFDIWTLRNWVSIIDHMWGWFCHNHTHRKLFCLPKLIHELIRTKYGIWTTSIQVIIECGCSFITATSTCCHFGYQKLIKGPTRLKFGMWSLSNHG